MIVYSFLLAVALTVSSPWWLWRMATSDRYRMGLRARLGVVRRSLRVAVHGREVIWLHAVSIGEVLAAEQLIYELQLALPGWRIAVSTTTTPAFKLAKQRLQGCPVFFMPLDFAYSMLRYLSVLKPRLVVLMESELWPRMLTECERAGVPVVVVNARVSDRSFPRYLRLKRLWKPLLAKVTIFLAQGDESAERLARIGVAENKIRVVGNLKYDAPEPPETTLTRALSLNLPLADFLVCGSTLEGEEVDIIEAWVRLIATGHRGVLMIAPRHPQRFEPVVRLVGRNAIRVSEWIEHPRQLEIGEILVLDSVGNLASVFRMATAAFIGGSLVPRGGHNPLEAARFGVPVVMGPHYENFREIVDGMRAADAVVIVEQGNLTLALHSIVGRASRGHEIGERGKLFFESQTGATERVRLALLDLLRPESAL